MLHSNKNHALLASAFTGAIFGLDFSNPQTVSTLLGGGLAFVALIVLWRIVTTLSKRDQGDTQNDGKTIDLVQMLVTDFKQSLDNNTKTLTSFQEFLKKTEAERAQRDEELFRRIERIEQVSTTRMELPPHPPV